MLRKEHATSAAAAQAAATQASEEVIYRIDIPANRYDMLCLEGIARALNVFRGLSRPPRYRLADMAGKAPQRLAIERETALVRPFAVAAVLRGVRFDKSRYDSFIDLQDKLHQNLCRQRSLVAIGTHDLSKVKVRHARAAVAGVPRTHQSQLCSAGCSEKRCCMSASGIAAQGMAHHVALSGWVVPLHETRYVVFLATLCAHPALRSTAWEVRSQSLSHAQGPFAYRAMDPTDITFVPLKQTQPFQADQLMQHYLQHDQKLKKFVPLIQHSPVYPVIYDSAGTVLSLPPIINGAHSAITLETTDVFIECTATDLTKAKIVLNTVVAMFSECAAPSRLAQSSAEPQLTLPALHSHCAPKQRWHAASVTQPRFVHT